MIIIIINNNNSNRRFTKKTAAVVEELTSTLKKKIYMQKSMDIFLIPGLFLSQTSVCVLEKCIVEDCAAVNMRSEGQRLRTEKT